MKRALSVLFCLAIGHAQPGTITSVVGAYHNGDGGPATKAVLDVGGLAIDREGNVYVADGWRIRKILRDGRIVAFACSASARGFAGDDGLAQFALCNMSTSGSSMTMGSDGGLIFVDRGNHRIRRVAPDGVITTIAGTGASGFLGDDGQATAARLASPTAVASGPDGSLYIGY